MSITEPNKHCWFQAETRLGCVHIGVRANESELANLAGPHRVFQQAALLSNFELFVQSLELWQKIDLDLIPSDAPDEFGITLRLCLKELNDTPDREQEELPELIVVFKDDVLSRLEPLSEVLSQVITVKGSSVKLQVELDCFEITENEYAHYKSDGFEAGSVVLLPGSFKPQWTVTAQSIDSEVDYTVRGKLNTGSGEFELSCDSGTVVDGANSNPAQKTDNREDEKNTGELRIFARNVIEAPIDRLLASEVKLPLNLDNLSLMVDGELNAYGSMIPYGRGSLFAVNEVVTG